MTTERLLVFLDVETLGLDAEHDIWEIAYAVEDGQIHAEVVEHCHRDADPRALAVNGHDSRCPRPDLDVFDPGMDGVLFEREVRAALHGATLIAANPHFDALRLFERWGDEPWHYRMIDVETYAMPALGLDRPPGLATIAERLGVTPPDHTAAGDVHTLRECWRLLRRTYGGQL